MPQCVAACFIALVVCRCSAADDRTSQHEESLRRHPPDVWALINATIVIDSSRCMNNGLIVIRDGRVQSVGMSEAVPADARILDLAEHFIYPGFINAWSTVDVTPVERDAGARHWNSSILPEQTAARNYRPKPERDDRLRKKGFVAKLLAPHGKVISGTSVLVATSGASANESIIATDVAQHIRLTVDRRSRSAYPGSPMGAVALARQTFHDAIWYRKAWRAAKNDVSLPRPEFNPALDALQSVIEARRPVVIYVSDEQFAMRANRFAAEFGLNLILRGSGREYRRLEDIAATGRPIIVPLRFPKAPHVRTPETARNASLRRLMHWDTAPENPGRLAAAGVNICFTIDGIADTDEFLTALRQSVQRGLSEAAALNALTRNPARLFTVADQLGSIDAGRSASFVVTDGPLFETKTKIVETWVAGERFEHTPKTAPNVAGRYELQLRRAGDRPRTLWLELTQESGTKIAGRISRQPFSEWSDDDKEISHVDNSNIDPDADDITTIRHVEADDYRITGLFTADAWEIEGVSRLSILVMPNGSEENSPSISGVLLWPDGSKQALRGRRSDSVSPESKTGGNESDAAPHEKESGNDAETVSFEPATYPVNYPFGAFGRVGLPEKVGLTAFTNATIWTSSNAGRLEHATLLIDDGRILDVGSGVAIPEGTTIVDTKGHHITAGIIDCHSHMATDGGVNEPTQAITCEVRIGDFIDANDITIYRQLAGGVTTSNILHGSANPIGGQNQVIKLRWGQTAEELKFDRAPPGVKFALGENVKQSNWGDQYRTRYPQTRMGVEQVFRDAFEAARDYVARHRAWRTTPVGLPPPRDLELDALSDILEGRRWIHCHSYRQDEILTLIRVLDDYGITIGTFQHILEGYKVADEMARHGAMASAFADWWAYKFEVYDAIPYAGALMHEAGVVVSFNSDDAELGTRLNQEAAKAVRYGGVTEEDSLSFVTLNPARQLRIDHWVGSLEPGKDADFSVWNGHPLSNLSHCVQTWIDGRCFFDRQEDRRMQRHQKKMRNTLIQKILRLNVPILKPGESEHDPSSLWPRHDEFCHEHGNDTDHAD